LPEYYYLDSCSIVRLLVKKEKGYEKISQIFEESNSKLFTSELTNLEVRAALKRKISDKLPLTNNKITRAEHSMARKEYAQKILSNIDYGKVTIIPVDSDLYNAASDLIDKYETLKTLDAIQLQTALFYKSLELTFVTSDNGLAEIASSHFKVINLNDY
jgi:predicted nucleic acid-binding protein